MFIVYMNHSDSDNAKFKTFKTYDAAVKRAHKFFEQYFTLVKGRPYDAGHDRSINGLPAYSKEAFDCFEDVKIHNGMVAEFTHCGGDGPVCFISNDKDS